MNPANINRYRTTRAIIVPAGTNATYVTRMKQDIYRQIQVLMTPRPDLQYTLLIDFDDALKAGLIEKIDGS